MASEPLTTAQRTDSLFLTVNRPGPSHVGHQKNMVSTGPIKSFFKNPDSEPSSEGDGVLFHLRRDLVKLLGAEGNHISDASPHAMMSLMGVLSGIDYLSQVYSIARGSRKRFVETVRELCAITEEDSQAIYQLRCAIMHSIALSTISDCDYRRGVKFNFEITDDDACPPLKNGPTTAARLRTALGFGNYAKRFLTLLPHWRTSLEM